MANVGANPSSEEDENITGDFIMATSRVNMRIKFSLNKLDDLAPADWYCHSGIVPLIPDRIEELCYAYTLPLRSIVKSCVNKCSKVEAVYIHFGCGGLFEFNPRAKALKNLSNKHLEHLLRNLFKKRVLVDQRDGVTYAREIRTSEEVETVYADLRENYLKIGCVRGPIPDCPTSWDDLKNELTGTKPIMFLFGDHLDVMEKKGLVDKLVQVSFAEYEMHVFGIAKLVRLTSRELNNKLVKMESTGKQQAKQVGGDRKRSRTYYKQR